MRYRKVCGFESHLGHSVFPRQGRFCFDVCTKLAIASSDGLGRGLWPGRRGAYSGVWVAGSGLWLVGPPPALDWGYAVPRFRFRRVGPGWPTPIHVPGERALHDRRDSGRRPLGARSQLGRRALRPSFCPAKGVWTLYTLTSVLLLCLGRDSLCTATIQRISARRRLRVPVIERCSSAAKGLTGSACSPPWSRRPCRPARSRRSRDSPRQCDRRARP